MVIIKHDNDGKVRIFDADFPTFASQHLDLTNTNYRGVINWFQLARHHQDTSKELRIESNALTLEYQIESE